jgi:hypothetical protein
VCEWVSEQAIEGREREEKKLYELNSPVAVGRWQQKTSVTAIKTQFTKTSDDEDAIEYEERHFKTHTIFI